MRKYMTSYINEIDEIIKSKKITEEIINNHLIKISFFQHERFIHLCVTLFYALMCLIFLGLTILSFIFIPIAIILFIFLIFYIYHYFFLENGVQYMYKQYDKLKELN